MNDEPQSEFSAVSWPLLTADLPGITGTLKARPEDFVVEEIPAYPPCGDGEHLFLWIEKSGVSADELTRHLSRALDISPRELGIAGLKDKHAVTRQFVSVPRRMEDRLHAIDTERIRLLAATPHANKLRTGHLRGNRFQILVRDPVGWALLPDQKSDGQECPAYDNALAIAERLRQTGVPKRCEP